MTYYRSIILLFTVFLFFTSCNSIKKTSAVDSKATTKETELSVEEQRKFDYFFYEACREKMKGNLEKSAVYLGECLKLDPSSSASMYELANILVAGQQPDKAQGVLERAVYYNPDNLWYKLLLADLYQNNKFPAKAISIYQDFVKEDHENIEYRYSLAQLYQQNKEYDKALDEYAYLEKVLGLNELIILEKEKIYVALGKNKQALAELNRLIEKFPDEARYYGYIADYYFYQKDLENARVFYQKVLEKDTKNGLAYFSLGNVELIANDTTKFEDYYSKALRNEYLPFDTKFQRLIPFLSQVTEKQFDAPYIDRFFSDLVYAHPQEANAYIYYGSYLKIVGRNSDALSIYAKALELNEKEETVWQDYLLLLADNKSFDSLYVEGKKAILNFPENSFFYLLTGSASMQLNKNEEANDLFVKGVKSAGENTAMKAQLYANLGDVNYALNKSTDAFYYFEESLKLNELNIVVLNNYSYYLSVEKKDLDKAEKMSSQCVDMEPGNSTYLDTYAWVLFMKERYLEAKYIIERAIDNGGDVNDVIVEHYGDILYKIGDVEGALVQWKKTLEINPTNKNVPAKIEQKKYIE